MSEQKPLDDIFKSLTNSIGNIFEPKALPKLKVPLDRYISALMGASGISINQAKTCVYYAVVTFRLKDLVVIGILTIMGDTGTGKSYLIAQMKYMVHNPREISVKTEAALRRKLSLNTTALIEEGDKADEQLLINRYSRTSSAMTFTEQSQIGWHATDTNLFGATIIHRRKPPLDAAMRNRGIYIRTRLNPGKYEVDACIDMKEIEEIAKGIDFYDIKGQGRTSDVWAPLISVAKHLGDSEWLYYAEVEKDIDSQRFVVGQDYEPQKAVRYVLEAKLKDNEKVLLSEIKRILRDHHGVDQTIAQIDEYCSQFKYKVTRTDGYPTVHRK